MVRHGTAKKRRRNLKVVRKLPKALAVRVAGKVQNAMVRANFDKTKNPMQNLREMGLCTDSNGMKKSAEEIRNAEANAEAIKNGVFQTFENANILEWGGAKMLPADEKAFKQLTNFEREYAAKLVAKFGDNYSKMERDTRVNDFQYTARQCEKLIARWNEEQTATIEKTPAQIATAELGSSAVGYLSKEELAAIKAASKKPSKKKVKAADDA